MSDRFCWAEGVVAQDRFYCIIKMLRNLFCHFLLSTLYVRHKSVRQLSVIDVICPPQECPPTFCYRRYMSATRVSANFPPHHLRWMDCVNRHMRAIGTTKDEVHDRTGWRRSVCAAGTPQPSGSSWKKKILELAIFLCYSTSQNSFSLKM